ncbi:S8 family serine peptidase [Streptomyces macrosporus]|uniref:Peptidase S8/S53 domain-containing protein n=1 Tax=Streptomyces macrosporus TaxID=44032 RepID=A0ABN3JIE4_9ACTN
MTMSYPDGNPRVLSKPKMPKLANGLPSIVYAQVSPRSIGGTSLFETGAVTARTAQAVQSETRIVDQAAQRLRDAGFTVFQDAPHDRGSHDLAPQATLNISGPPDLYERAFHCSLEPQERPVLKENQQEDLATFVECPQTDMPGFIDTADTDFADVLEGVALEEPRFFFATALAPPTAYWHLDVPGDVSLGCNADRAHRMGVTGTGVKVVMTDSGHFVHPFFSARGYKVGPVVLGPGATAPADDESGHGTAESANIFAIAPDVDFTMVKMSFFNTIAAFNKAVALNPHVISNSWGSSKRRPSEFSAADQALAAAVAVAVARGITVVFSAGNGQFGFPGQHPDVISAGGVFLSPDGTMRASDYSSGFASRIFPGRNSPDLCGLVGMRPRAAYIMLPVQPHDDIDRDLAGSRHPDGDETSADDGWAAISGTSAAAPQIAGACALIKQVNPRLTPAQVRDILRGTARDVAAGHCFDQPDMGHPAAPGPDLATGTGLVDAHAAVVAAGRS